MYSLSIYKLNSFKTSSPNKMAFIIYIQQQMDEHLVSELIFTQTNYVQSER